jgi:hypothetical protein
MNMPLDEDRRSEHRLFIRLPIIVTGEIEGGEVWRESTRTINVSVGGTLINLIHPVRRDEQFLLRANFPNGAASLFLVKVVWAVAEQGGMKQIGIEILDSTEEWARLFLSWASDVRDY